MNSYYEKMADGSVRCIDSEIPFAIPDSWAWCRLGEISTYAQTKRKINASKADPQLWGLDLEDIEKGGRLLKIRTVGERKAIGDKTIFNRGDILYSKLRPYLLKIIVAPKNGICTPEIIPFSCYGNICKDYIVNFLKSPYVDDHINSVTFGVKMPRVSTETMTSLLVPLPPLSEQSRIEIRIKGLMPFIEIYGIAQARLDALNKGLSDTIRKSILQEAIQGRLVPQIASEGTAEELLAEIKAEKKRLVKEGKLKKSALTTSRIFRGDDNRYRQNIDGEDVIIDDRLPFEIPDTWRWVTLGELIVDSTGLSYKKESLADKSEPLVRVLRGGNIEEGQMLFKVDDVMISAKYVPDNLYLRQGTFISPAVSSLEKIGKTALIEQDYDNVVAGGFVLLLSPLYSEDNLGKYLYYFFQTGYYHNYCRTITKKSGQAFYNLSRPKLKECYVPIPPKAELSRIIDQIDKILAGIMSR